MFSCQTNILMLRESLVWSYTHLEWYTDYMFCLSTTTATFVFLNLSKITNVGLSLSFLNRENAVGLQIRRREVPHQGAAPEPDVRWRDGAMDRRGQEGGGQLWGQDRSCPHAGCRRGHPGSRSRSRSRSRSPPRGRTRGDDLGSRGRGRWGDDRGTSERPSWFDLFGVDRKRKCQLKKRKKEKVANVRPLTI